MMKHLLFSYGTLQIENVQIQNYGRLLIGTKDSLQGYTLSEVEITDKSVIEKSGKKFHPIALKTNNLEDFITGTIFEITDLELHESDKYEVSDYERILETFVSNKKAWVYVSKNN